MLGKKLRKYTEVYSKVTQVGMEIVTSGKTYEKIGDVRWKEEIYDFKGATMTSPCWISKEVNNVYAPVLSDMNMAFCEICVTVISSLHSRICICGISEILLDAELNTAHTNFPN